MRGRERLHAYLTSRQNLVACGMALVGLGLALLDPVGPTGLVLVIGFYALGAAAARPNRAHARFGFDPRDIEKAFQQEISDVSGRVPPELVIRIQRIELIARTQVLPRLERLPPGSVDLYLVEQTARRYLPTAIDNYLRLPAGYSSRQSGSDGATALQVVTDELSMLEAEMRRIANVVLRADMDRLLAHRRFLNDRLSGADLSG